MYNRKLQYLVFSLLVCSDVSGQTKNINFTKANDSLFLKTRKELVSFQQFRCKGFVITHNSIFDYSVIEDKNSNKTFEPFKKQKLISIKGSVSYDFFYRSRIDTPFQQQDFQQHTERVNLNILIKEKYPLRINFSSRQTNSPLLGKFANMGLSFDQQGFQRNVKAELLKKIINQNIVLNQPILEAERELEKLENRLKLLKELKAEPSLLQKLVEERERIYREKTGQDRNLSLKTLDEESKKDRYSLDSFFVNGATKMPTVKKNENISNPNKKANSLINKIEENILHRESEIDSLERNLFTQKNKLDSLRKTIAKDISKIQNSLSKASSSKEIKNIARKNGIKVSNLSSLEDKLTNIKTLGIGRNVVNYTELTAQNITVTGINIEYNSSYYTAFVAGKLDYRFRDFLNNDSRKNNNQYFVMGRIGTKMQSNKSLIFSYFKGRKSNSNYTLPDSIEDRVDIVGYSIEGIIKPNDHTFLSAEFAKSTKPYQGNTSGSKQGEALFNFSDKSNVGVNIKAETEFIKTKTTLSGFYRKTGENFQSFSLFSYNNNQEAWLARLDQSLSKDKIRLTGMVRKNDFTNPFTNKTFKSSTVFGSFLANFRFPKLPILSIGYYPGTQLFVIDKETIQESAYYILNASLIYSYRLKDKATTTSINLNKYNNQASDSGFIAYNGIIITGTHNMAFKRLLVQGSYSLSKQERLTFSTSDISGSYTLKKYLSFGAGIKYNNVHNGLSYIGKSAQIKIELKKLGLIQLQYDKSFLPSLNSILFPVEIGRLSYYKYF